MTGVITTRAITVTAVTDTKQYDGTTSSTGVPTITVGSLLGGDSATWTQSFDSSAIGTGKTLTPTGTVTDGNSGNNYTVTFVTNMTGVITTRAITVTAVTDTKPFDGTTTSSGVPTITVGSLLGGDSATWTQSFDTSSVGTGKTLTPTGTVTDGNSGNNYTVTFVANMTGVITATCEIAIEQPVLNDLIDGSASVNFGTKNVAETSSLTFTVRNTGIGPLSLGAITIDGTHAGDYTITVLPVGPVSAAGSTTFVVAFSPLQAGASTAVLHLVNGDSNENPFDITLAGTGTNIIGSVLEETTPVVTVSNGDFVATDLNIETDLGFIPTPGSAYTYIDIVNPINGIIGTFNDLPDGGVIAMNFDGVIYYFQADYAGGSGNDLTLTNFTPAAAPAWRWAAGPNKRNNAANFGTLNVASATNNPGSRQGAMNWRGTDGSLWMFGGYGYAAPLSGQTPNGLNDLWQFNRTLGQWIWRSGSSTQGAAGVYGSITVEAAGRTPGARHTGSTWTDGSGNLWLFGGFNGNSTFPARYNDLWRYRPSTGRWTWMKGSSSAGQVGVYGSLGVAAAGNTPGARQGAASWFTPDGNLWLFGGFNGTAYFNDLWNYNLASGRWTWVSGSNTTTVSKASSS